MVWAVWHWSLIVEMLKGLASCGVAGEEKPHKSLTVPADFDQKHNSQPGLHRGLFGLGTAECLGHILQTNHTPHQDPQLRL